MIGSQSLRLCMRNKEVRAKIQQAIGPHEDLLTIVKKRKLQWYGHVSRSSGLAETILQGTVKGRRRQDRQGRDGKTTSGNGQAWNSPSPRWQWRTGKNGENWLQKHLWCPTTLAVKGLMMMRRLLCGRATLRFNSMFLPSQWTGSY